MNGKLIDTNIIIYLSKRKIEPEKVASSEDRLYISVITYMEVLGYKFENKFEKQKIVELCSHFPVINLNSEIVNKVISVRQKHKIKLPDAIILATAVVSKMDLITANVSDFIRIEPDLKIFNPMDQI
jgi:predicted nucleic acid-binding protein